MPPNHLDHASDEPLYNIGIVSRMTGIPVATLRVWERRYDFPNSTRTPGGHRLVSEKEVMRLRWVKARVDEGMQTGQAIRALQHMEQEGRLNDLVLVPPPRPIAPMADASLPVFGDRLTESLLAHDLETADQLLGEILGLYPLEDLVLDVVTPALNAIGSAWVEGRINIATEHLATNYLRQHLLHWMMTGVQAYPGVRPILLVCAPEELHEGSLLIAGVLLSRMRWPVAYLGQSVPLADIADLSRKINTPAIVFVAMTEVAAAALQQWPDHLPEAQETNRPIVGYGGRIFNEDPAWRSRIPGVYLGDTLREGILRLDEMLRTNLGPPN
jgi:DNA-binding transcriptional MerR regulator